MMILMIEEIEKSEGDDELLALKSFKSSLLLQYLFNHMKYMKNLSLKALIYGLKCTGRGYERRVTDNMTMTLNEEYASVMKLSWNDRKEYSSWCKFRFSTRFNSTNKYVEDSINYLNSNPNNSSYYGQFNFFMKLFIPSEEILHGVKIASVTSVSNHTPLYIWNHFKKKKYEQYQSRSTIDCIDFNKLIDIQQSALFIPFTDIFATKYGVIGVDNNNKPFLNKTNKLPKKEDMKESNFSSERINNISKLYFVELQPERRDVKFDLNNNEMYNS